MSGLIGSLINNFQALNAQAQALAVTGKNLANINNPGYARQSVILGSQGSVTTAVGVQNMGVEAMGLKQARDILLDRQLQRDISITSGLDAKQGGLQAAQAAVGQQLDRTTDTGAVGSASGSAGSGINEGMSTFFSTFDSWSINPSNNGEKQLLLQNAEILADKINTADANLTQVQSDLTDQVAADVTIVNDILTAISNFNNSIARAENIKPYSAVDMRDERQAKIEELAKYMNFQVQEIPGSHGQVSLAAADGGGAPVYLINPLKTGNVTFDGTNFSAGAVPTQLALTGGSLNASVEVRDGGVTNARTELKKLADQLTISVNAAYNPLSTAGQNFFSAAPASGLIRIEATTANLRATLAGTSGGNDLAVAVAGLSTKIFSTGAGDGINGSLSSHFSGMVASLGLELSNTTNQLQDQKLTETNTRVNRDDISGVSQDEELANMLRFQRSYQACARYTNAIDSLLELVVTRLGSF